MPTVHLLDASLYIFRAYHSVRDSFTDSDGHPVHAVYGFASSLFGLLEQARPSHLGVAFDESLTTSFRNEIYPQYKANRELPPSDLALQFTYCKALAAALGLSCLFDRNYEADDLIGSAVTQLRAKGFRAVIISADKDLAQLIGKEDEQIDFGRDQRWDTQGVKKRLGVYPHQVADYLALTGDAVDNIPGVPGIGPKTAATLLAHFGSLDDLYARIEEVPYLRFRGAGTCHEKLKTHRAQAELSRRLTLIACDAPLSGAQRDFATQAPDATALAELFDKLRFGPLTRARAKRWSEARLAQANPA